MMNLKTGLVGLMTAMVLFAMAAPSFAFDPPDKDRGARGDKTIIIGQDNRRPHGLYPRDQRQQRALDQMMRHDRTRSAVKSGEILSLSDIRGRVTKEYPGRIVNVELYERGRDMIYEVRVLTGEGDVLSVHMDARQGNVLSVRGKR